MALIAYSTGDQDNPGFIEKVKQVVFPDLEPENLATVHANYIQNGLITAQKHVPCLRSNNVNFYTSDDWEISCGAAWLAGPSENARIQAVYAFKPCTQCTRFHYEQQPAQAIMCWAEAWCDCNCASETDRRHQQRSGQDFCDNEDEETATAFEREFKCEERIFARTSDGKIHIAPRPPCDYMIAVHWEGVKRHYAAADLLPDDDDLIDTIALYVQAERALRNDRDLQLHKELFELPMPGKRGGRFWQAIENLQHLCREETKIRPAFTCYFDDHALPGFNPLPEVDQSACEFEAEEVTCGDGQYVLDGECADCEDPTVTISVDNSAIVAGGSATISWSNTVPAIDSSVVTLEYGSTVTVLDENSSGTLVVSPTESTTYLIRAETDCGNVVATVGISVSEAPCVCPDGLPDCLAIDLVDPLDFTQCSADNYDACDEQIPWDGTIPRISDCVWDTGFGEANGSGAVSVNFGNPGPICRAFRARVELISCDPFVYELTLSSRFEGDELIFWKGRTTNHPVGTYTSQDYGVGQLDSYCYAETDFALTGCFDTPCTPPEIRFDPPSGEQVDFPTLVFIHSTTDTDFILYSINGGSYVQYTGPITLDEGQTLAAYAISQEGCEGNVFEADYEIAEGVEFAFICDTSDQAGVFGIFEPNGSNDYHWRITVARNQSWTLHQVNIYETDSDGVWVTGQAWATINPIYPIELSPDPFSVYPLVLINGGTQVNTAYGDPLANYSAGTQVLHGYGQSFIALTGYFRLELTIEEDGDTFTIYKLIPHTCLTECPSASKPTVSIDCDGEVTLQSTVTPGVVYRIMRATNPPCGTGVFADVVSGFTLDGNVTLPGPFGEPTEVVALGCEYTYIVSVYCDDTESWVDSAPTVADSPTEAECSCSNVDCAELQDYYYLSDVSGIQLAVQNCTVWGDCDAVPGTLPEGCTGEAGDCALWDLSYSRADEGCTWTAPSGYTYDGTYGVKSDLRLVTSGDDCYWSLRFWCNDDVPGQVEYRKTSGNSPVGTYTLTTDACSAEAAFPASISIVSEVP